MVASAELEKEFSGALGKGETHDESEPGELRRLFLQEGLELVDLSILDAFAYGGPRRVLRVVGPC